MDDLVRAENSLAAIVDGNLRQHRYTRIVVKETGDELRVTYDELRAIRELLLTLIPRDMEALHYRKTDGAAPICALYVMATHGDVEQRANYAPILTEYFRTLACNGYADGTLEGVSRDFERKVGIGYHAVWAAVHWIYAAYEAAGLTEQDVTHLYQRFGVVRDELGDNLTPADLDSYRNSQIN